MNMNADKFSEIAVSLRQYRRAELEDFQASIDAVSPIDAFYVDPLPSNAVLKTMLQNNTTFLVGRKGTGKSTVFAKSQFELRKKSDVISVYVDVKSLHEVLALPAQSVAQETTIDVGVLQAHQLKKTFLASILTELIIEVGKAYDKQSLIKKWLPTGAGNGYFDVLGSLKKLTADVSKGKLTDEEIPLLATISSKSRDNQKQTVSSKNTGGGGATLSAVPSLNLSIASEKFDESIAENEMYHEYADVVLRSFPFKSILEKIKELLVGVKLKKLLYFLTTSLSCRRLNKNCLLMWFYHR